MPGFSSDEVGAGFIDERLLLDRLAEVDGLELARRFSPSDGEFPESANRELKEQLVFDRAQLGNLAKVVYSSGPAWVYDYPGQRFGIRPIDPQILQSLPANERTLGISAHPLSFGT